MQGDFLARAKNHANPISQVPAGLILAYHAFLHACGVYYFTQSAICASIEFLTHMLFDFCKNAEIINFKEDQVFHILVKFIIAAFAFYSK